MACRWGAWPDQQGPFESLFFEMEYGRPMELSTQTVEELKRARLIQEPAPLPWRDEELKYVVRALGIEEQKQARGFEEVPT